jgi:hypothetical protein
MSEYARRRRDPKLLAKQMYLVTAVPQSFGSAIKNPLSAAAKLQSLMGQADFHF